jgi:hypothetical protein
MGFGLNGVIKTIAYWTLTTVGRRVEQESAIILNQSLEDLHAPDPHLKNLFVLQFMENGLLGLFQAVHKIHHHNGL